MPKESASSNQEKAPKKLYSLKPVYTPLPSQVEEAHTDKQASASADPQIRAENEDDDGYDPFSDRVEKVPFFEKDPWS